MTPEKVENGTHRHLYRVFGLTIASDVPLPELAAAPFGGEPDIRICHQYLAPSANNGLPTSDDLRVDDDQVLLTIDQVARYRIRAGRDIAIDPLPGASERQVRLFLLGSALGIVCHQRGLLPLHANALVVNGRAVAFAGDSGAGKSTLAAHFQARGYEVLCDDVCMVEFREGAPRVWPGLRRLKLWRDAAERFGHAGKNEELVAEGIDKLQVPLAGNGATGPYPLSRLYLLETGTPADIQRLRGANALQAVVANTYRNQFLPAMGLMPQHFRQATALAAKLGIFRARRRWGFDVFATEAAQLERHMLCGDDAAVSATADNVGVHHDH